MLDGTAFYKGILDNMTDGVMALDFSGQIIMFNPAASEVLGLTADQVLGRRFAEVFMMELEGNDDFNQTVLDAIYKSGVGETAEVAFQRPDGEAKSLSVVSSYLTGEGAGSGADGEAGQGGESQGVIVVFHDITATKLMQEQEQELHRKIRDASLKMEETNRDLKAALKKVQVIRMAATLFVLVLFLGIGFWAWANTSIVSRLGAMTSSSSSDQKTLPTVPVVEQPVTNSISLVGNLEPIKEVNVVSPFSGKIREKMFEYGDAVKKGDLLLRMDTSEIEVKLRDAESAYITARQEYEDKVNWSQGSEVARAKRTLASAKARLDTAARKLDETQLLYDKGIVPQTELESAQESLQSAKMEFHSSQDDLNSTQVKGNAENVNIARLKLANARTQFETLKEEMQRFEVYAPVSGIVVKPQDQGNDKAKIVERGVSFNKDDILLAVGDLEGLAVKAEVDEVDISRIMYGQKVTVSGDAFPSMELTGRVSFISSQASKGQQSGVPMFDVRVVIDKLTPEHQRMIRLGMTANLQVVVYENPKALMVPISAVRSDMGRHYVVVETAPGVTEEVTVKTGMTTIDSVEILGGVGAGQKVVLGPGGGMVGMPMSGGAPGGPPMPIQ
ncbi:MAG: efflux RND transporter periplasmic adaptor subunit [Desulfovibrionaceae bacterium]|jgi:PAS domain S-box-containing protein|nr:efflux RND transporter periplasmic adaptor subunit [Desulfovibrionaceae bacterium]